MAVSDHVFKWSAHRWHGPVTINHEGDLFSVSCASTSFCMVVGIFGDAIRWTGKWHDPVTIDTPDRFLNSVSCASSSLCIAVDHTGRSFGWNG
jgi:hypothetical protein